MGLLFILKNKINLLFWNYIHKILLFRTEALYPHAFLKPLSGRYLRHLKKNYFGYKCNCFFCNTINNSTQSFKLVRNLARDGWRVWWTSVIKHFLMCNLYNHLSMHEFILRLHLRATFPETFVVVEYESIYLFIRDLFLVPVKYITGPIYRLLNIKTIENLKSWPLKRHINTAKLVVRTLRQMFMKVYKFFWTQQFIYFLYKSLKTFILSACISLLFGIILIVSMKVIFLQHLAAWLIFGNIFFWLMSGFNFFIKRGRFGKFTARLQRFWKHAFVSFWAVEGFLFSLFFYYYLNSSQEPLYMYDKTNLTNDFVLNLQSGFFNTFILSSILFGCQLLILMISVRSQFQSICLLLLISVGVFYLFFLESYQIYYVFNGFTDIVCVFDEDQNCWSIESESIKLRIKQYYFVLCVIAKFWHFIFIFFSWIFFLLKSLEMQKISYNLLSFNYQNLLILFVLNLLCYCNWAHFLFRKFFDVSYFWFFTAPDQKHLRLIVDEAIHIILSCFEYNSYEIQLINIVNLIN